MAREDRGESAEDEPEARASREETALEAEDDVRGADAAAIQAAARLWEGLRARFG